MEAVAEAVSRTELKLTFSHFEWEMFRQVINTAARTHDYDQGYTQQFAQDLSKVLGLPKADKSIFTLERIKDGDS